MHRSLGCDIVALFLCLASAPLGCRTSNGDCPPFESPCPQRLDLRDYCSANNKCFVEALLVHDLWVDTNLDVNQTLTIDLGNVDLTSTPDLFLLYLNGTEVTTPAVGPEPRHAVVTINGAVGSYFPINPARNGDRGGVNFRWPQLPTAPRTLKVLRPDGNIVDIDVGAHFENAACENTNPRPYCGE